MPAWSPTERARWPSRRRRRGIGDHDTLARLAKVEASGMTIDDVVTEM
ncbi:hypothetical protein ABZ345_05305 [Lentzea sp. NPDC005914]